MDLEQLIDTSADLLDSGKADQAKKLCLEAIEIKPDCVEAWINLSFAELQLGNVHSAEQASKRAIAIDPTHATDPTHGTAWHNLGEAYVRMGLAEQSLQCNNRALLLDNSQAVFWFGKGEALMMLEHFTEAIACFDKALAIDPQYSTAQLNKELAWLQSSPERLKLLHMAIGFASMHSEGKIDQHRLVTEVLNYFSNEPIFNKDLVQSFDYFAQANIQMSKPLLVHFCMVNLILAIFLQDAELTELCQNRLNEAQLK